MQPPNLHVAGQSLTPHQSTSIKVVTYKGEWQDEYTEIYKTVQAKDTHLDIEPPGAAGSPAAFKVGMKVCAAIQDRGQKGIY